MYGVSHSCVVLIQSVEADEPVWTSESWRSAEDEGAAWTEWSLFSTHRVAFFSFSFEFFSPFYLFIHVSRWLCLVTDTLLFLYLQAAHYLHEEAARYPRKIHYHNPPDLAMEALEVNFLWLVAQKYPVSIKWLGSVWYGTAQYGTHSTVKRVTYSYRTPRVVKCLNINNNSFVFAFLPWWHLL